MVCIARFQVLKAASMNMTAFWDIEPCGLVEQNFSVGGLKAETAGGSTESRKVVTRSTAPKTLMKTVLEKYTDCRLLVVMGRDFVSALQPGGLLYYPRMKANLTV
jgi:hypothetical protein